MIYVLLTYLFYPFLYLVMLFKKSPFIPSTSHGLFQRGPLKFPPLAKGGKEGFSNSIEFKKILVIQTAKIGDMICSTPIFREIKKKYPSVILSVIASPITAKLLKHNSHVDNVIALNIKNTKGISGKLELIKLLYKRKYDVSLSLNPNIPFTIAPLWALIPMRIAIMPNFCGATLKIASEINTHNVRHETGKLVVETYMEMLEFLNIQAKDISKEVYKSPDADEKAEEFLSRFSDFKSPHPHFAKGGDKEEGLKRGNIISPPLKKGDVGGFLDKSPCFIGIAISSGNKLKELGEEKITELINKFLDNFDVRVVLIGSDADKTTADKVFKSINKKNKVINATGKFNLSELPALIERLSFFIGVDTGITYMADAFSVPLIDIAGPSDMSDQRPLGENSLIIQKNIPCVPCSHAFKAPYSCKIGDRRCITSISVSEIIEAVTKLLQGHKI